MKKIQFTPTFVQTKNVRSFETMMDGLMFARGGAGECDERLGCVWGRAGRGKTRTVQTWAARTGCPYVEAISIWSELDFLRGIAAKLGVHPGSIPFRRGTCFDVVVNAFMTTGRPLFIDEIELTEQKTTQAKKFIEIARNIAKITGGVIVCIGEEELPHIMMENRRTWSRTYRQMEFKPISGSDIYLYINQTTGLNITDEAIALILKRSGGDLRVIRSITINLTHAASSLGRDGEVDVELIKIACKLGLQE